MIRKLAMVAAMALLFAYTAWNFYDEVIRQPAGPGGPGERRAAEGRTLKVRKSDGAWSAAIHEKNLFSPDRTYVEPKPIPIVVPKPVEPPPKRPEVVLKGIVLDTFGDYIGYIEIDQAKPTPVRKGDKVEEIEVLDVQEKKVVLQWKTEQMTLSMDKIKTIRNPKAGAQR
ncbi:MAG: hypothetical protein OHK006_09920 [Thermodesulfovibrionales bacterium]